MLKLMLHMAFSFRGYGALVGYFVNHPLYTPPSTFYLLLSFFFQSCSDILVLLLLFNQKLYKVWENLDQGHVK